MVMGFGLILVFMALAAAGWLFGRLPAGQPQPRGISAREIAEARYANGEIDKQQFIAVLNTLDSTKEK